MLCYGNGHAGIFNLCNIARPDTPQSNDTWGCYRAFVLRLGIGQFYGKKKIASYLKGLGAYMLGMITFWMIPVLIGTMLDILK